MRYNQVNGILLNEAPKERCHTRSAGEEKIHNPLYLRLLRWLLYAIAILAFTWPVYRAFLNIEITDNEGWNAYFAMRPWVKCRSIRLAAESSQTTIRPFPFTSWV